MLGTLLSNLHALFHSSINFWGRTIIIPTLNQTEAYKAQNAAPKLEGRKWKCKDWNPDLFDSGKCVLILDKYSENEMGSDTR